LTHPLNTMIDFAKVKGLKVLLIGDGIVDEYVYVKPLGKSIKDVAISAQYQRCEEFNGGVWAAAQHTRNFCDDVSAYAGPKVMRNTRYVEEAYVRKMFTLHVMRVDESAGQLPDIGAYDCVIVTDFGHGTMSKEMIQKVSKESRFLAVNAQTNTNNYGFNLITKYPRADYVVVDELEARLAAHDRDGDIEDVILKLGFKNIIVTMGYKGAVGFDGGFYRAKGTTKDALDTMGAGDAFLAVTAPFAAARFSMKDLVRIGNAAGAAKIGIIGHRSSVDKKALEDHLVG
jgi:bifunctional ADP-heptose synthase (sugar kinase/adenylyltransferase)